MITLDKESGVNPRISVKQCNVCAAEYEDNEILLLGAVNKIYTCTACGQTHIGYPAQSCCVTCSSRSLTQETIGSGHTIKTGVGVCPACQEGIDKVEEAGGTFLIETVGEDASSRTGRRWGISKEAAERMGAQPGVMLIPDTLAKQMGLHAVQATEASDDA